VEATITDDGYPSDPAARKRINQVYDALNQLESPNFFIGIDLRGAPDKPVPAKKIRTFLAAQLAKLDPDQVAKDLKDNGSFDISWPFEYAGWNIELHPIPKSPEARGKPGIRPLGFWSIEPTRSNARGVIREAVLRKARAYGRPNLPYLVAVDVFSEFVHRLDITDALFGDEQTTVYWGPNTPHTVRNTRSPNGAWVSKKGPRYKRLSGVLVTESLAPWNFFSRTPCIYHNPWATHPLGTSLAQLSQAIPQSNGQLQWTEDRLVRELFDLPENWPQV
jgi:hypothetical protein